jgi:hypothetical protein
MVGDTVGGFRVAGIKKDRIILAQGAREYEILLYDKDKPKVGAPARKKAKPTAVKAAQTKSGPQQTKVIKKKESTKAIREAIMTRFGKINLKSK